MKFYVIKSRVPAECVSNVIHDYIHITNHYLFIDYNYNDQYFKYN